MFEDGIGVDQDYKQAVKWYRLAGYKGDADAQYCMGMLYEQGKEIPKDYKKVMNWYLLPATQRNGNAQNNLGRMYYKGLGVPQDYVLAHMWFNLSGSNGNKSAIKNRNIVEEKMTPQQIEKAQEMARNWKPKQESKGLFEQFKEKFGIK